MTKLIPDLTYAFFNLLTHVNWRSYDLIIYSNTITISVLFEITSVKAKCLLRCPLTKHSPGFVFIFMRSHMDLCLFTARASLLFQQFVSQMSIIHFISFQTVYRSVFVRVLPHPHMHQPLAFHSRIIYSHHNYINAVRPITRYFSFGKLLPLPLIPQMLPLKIRAHRRLKCESRIF